MRHEDSLAGLVVRVSMAPSNRGGADRTVHRSTASDPPPLPGLVGRAPAWLHSCQDAERRFIAAEWVAVVGERGVGKQSLLRAVQLRRQPTPRTAVLDAAEAGVPRWMIRLREALAGGADSVMLTHVDQLEPATLRAVKDALHAARSGPGASARWVGVTASGASPGAEDHELVDLFPTTVEVPPLRQHPDDIPALVSHFLARMGEGRPLRCSPEALAMLTRFSWPGNAHQLQRVLMEVRRHRRSGTIEPDDLPAELHALSRRVLTHMESLERDAIVQALIDTNGDKARAAEMLGMSRATVYRRIRAYGIVELVTPLQ